MSSSDDCVLIISHYCRGCDRVVDRLAANSRCPHCGSSRVIERAATDGRRGHPMVQTIDLTSDLDDSSSAQTMADTSGPTARQSLNVSLIACSICLDSLDSDGDREERTLECNHRFHALCIDEWFAKEPTCPICRRRVGPEPDVTARLRVLQESIVALVARVGALRPLLVTAGPMRPRLHPRRRPMISLPTRARLGAGPTRSRH